MYSDHVPPLIVPDSPQGRAFRVKARSEAPIEVGLCDRYLPYPGVIESACDIHMPLELGHPCRNRDSSGVRNHNWCYRCLVGYHHVEMHIHDAAQDADRAVLIHS